MCSFEKSEMLKNFLSIAAINNFVGKNTKLKLIQIFICLKKSLNKIRY